MSCGSALDSAAPEPAPAAAPAPPSEPSVPASPPEERRQVTVLFADLSGYTAVAEKMDRIGFHALDFMGMIQFDVCVRYLREDPWERIRQVRRRVVETPLKAAMLARSPEAPKLYR